MSKLRAGVKRLIPQRLFHRIEPWGHLLEAMLWASLYGFPARGMHVIGVTGTNGKTTTSFMIHKILVKAGYNVALMTTVANGVGENITPQIAHMTTVSSRLLQKRLKEYRKQGAKWLVLETTSHALAQHRVWGVPYEIAVMTNVTHEHLDYHGTFEAYLNAKLQLFRIANKHGKRTGIINADDENARQFIECIQHAVTYGMQAGNMQATEVDLRPDGSTYQLVDGEERYQISCTIPGEFNVYNSLAAAAAAKKAGVSTTDIQAGLAALEGVEGRMDTIDEGQVFSVVIDFAHTPDSFERLLSDMRRSTKGKMVVVFGSAGRRDEAKRAVQGEIAGKYADEVVLTEEDDRDIDGNLILSQIAEGAERSGKVKDKDMFLILDRVNAIQFAMTRVSAAGDAVILLGKGHEKTIERADGEHSWSEAETARDAIKKLTS